MTSVSGVDFNKPLPANYNAVKIQINDPVTSIPEGFKPSEGDFGTYNAVTLEVNRPTVEVRRRQPLYQYAEAQDIVPFEQAVIAPMNLPKLPVAGMYQTFINNKTLVNAEIEIENPKNSIDKVENIDDVEQVENVDEEIETVETEFEQEGTPVVQEIITAEIIEVPAPNLVSPDSQEVKSISELSFHGINFKGNDASIQNKVEIVPPEEIKPEVNVSNVVKNLTSSDYDTQALQMEEIARTSMEDSEKAVHYVVTEIFSELINIVKADTSELTPPNEKQVDIRKKIIINEIVKEQAKNDGQDIEKLGLPYQLTEDEIKIATTLTPLEQAERNKEYALYTMAILDKVYVDNVEKQTGNVVPLTDLPGVSSVVDTLRYSENSGVKIAAIDALRYIYRPEYNDEIKSVLKLAAQDKDPYAARNAAVTLVSIEEMEQEVKQQQV